MMNNIEIEIEKIEKNINDEKNIDDEKLSTNVWGNHFWMTMYSVALSFPNNPSDEIRKHTLDFFTSLQYLLPCDNCKSHYQKLFQEFPINLNSSKDLSNWVNFIHNKVLNLLILLCISSQSVKQILFINIILFDIASHWLVGYVSEAKVEKHKKDIQEYQAQLGRSRNNILFYYIKA